MTKLVTMTPEGRITIPAAARRQIGVEGEATFEVGVDGESIVLRPAVVMTREDAWAYTADHRRLLAKAHQDSREGRVQRLTDRQLARLESR